MLDIAKLCRQAGSGLEAAALYWSFVLGAGVLGPAANQTRPKGNDLREAGIEQNNRKGHGGP